MRHLKDALLSALPEVLLAAIRRTLGDDHADELEEVRLRVGQPVLLKCHGKEFSCGSGVKQALLKEILARATEYSVYAYQEPLHAGWLPLPGGVRIGVAARLSGDGMKDVSSLCIRRPYAGEVLNDAEFSSVYPAGFINTLILSPPGFGKTTLLRTLIRRLSAGGYTVGVVDDRMEIAAVRQGLPSFDLGPRTDVLSGGTKKQCAMMLLRSMSPDIIAFDEITAAEDIEAAREIAFLGVGLLSTAHARDASDLQKRALYREIMTSGVYDMAIIIRMEDGKRRYKVEKL